MLQVKNVKKAYGKNQVLTDVSFVVPEGRCLGLQGENGSGKSTLLRIVAGLEKADSGQVLYDGHNLVTSKSLRRKIIGYVPQSGMLMEDLTGKEQLKLWQSACGVGGPIPGDLIEVLGLDPLLRTRISVMSGGQQKRISVAMALLNRPKLLLMDEVTASLDSAYTDALLDYLSNCLKSGSAMIWCSHNQAEFSRLADTVLTMKDGQLK